MLFSFPKQNEGIHYTFGLHGNLLRQLNRNSCYAQNGLSADYAKTAQTPLLHRHRSSFPTIRKQSVKWCLEVLSVPTSALMNLSRAWCSSQMQQ